LWVSNPGMLESRQFPERCILVGETIGITEIAAVPADKLVGIVCMRGSAGAKPHVLPERKRQDLTLNGGEVLSMLNRRDI